MEDFHLSSEDREALSEIQRLEEEREDRHKKVYNLVREAMLKQHVIAEQGKSALYTLDFTDKIVKQIIDLLES